MYIEDAKTLKNCISKKIGKNFNPLFTNVFLLANPIIADNSSMKKVIDSKII
jgi:hypothetical protein